MPKNYALNNSATTPISGALHPEKKPSQTIYSNITNRYLALIGAGLLLATSPTNAGQMASTNNRHFTAPPNGIQGPSQPNAHRMGTTRATRSRVFIGDYLSTFSDSVAVADKATMDCVRGVLHPKVPGHHKVKFTDRILQGGSNKSVVDPNHRLTPGTLYAFTNPGSSSCVVWRIVR